MRDMLRHWLLYFGIQLEKTTPLKVRNGFMLCRSTYQSLIDIFVIDKLFVVVVVMVHTFRDIAAN